MLSSLNIPLPQVAPHVKVLVRGWLNCNQVIINQTANNILIDAGYHSHADLTIAMLRDSGVSDDKNYFQLINTHCHSDHMGGNAAIQRAFGCKIAVPIGEAAGIRPWSRQAFWLDYADQHAEPFDYDDTISPGDEMQWGAMTWRAIAAPGHDAGALMFYCEELKLLISGDALWQNGLGAITPKHGSNPGIEAALATLQTIRALQVEIVIPGHGAPFSDVIDAIARAESRMQAFAQDPRRCAKSFLKGLFTFRLLERGSMSKNDVADCFAKVPCFAETNAQFFRLAPGDLAHLLVNELSAAHAVKVSGNNIMPAMAA